MPLEQMNPVIIIGAGRSGTNILRDVLTSFPGIGTWPCDEINYIWRHGNKNYPNFVLSWENLRLAYWISYYGNWDLVTGESNPGQIQRVKGDVQFDLEKGKIKMQDRNIPLSTLDVINKQGARNFSWSSGRGVHALLNKLSKEMYLMDSKMYNSMMVQMLVKDPENFEDNFKLVVDHFPWNRACLVK